MYICIYFMIIILVTLLYKCHTTKILSRFLDLQLDFLTR